MTPSAALAFARSHAIALLLALCAVLALAAGEGWRRAHEFERQVGAARRGAELRAKGELVPDIVSPGAAAAKAAEAAAKDPTLAGEVAAAKRHAPSASVAVVVQAASEPAPVHAQATPQQAAPRPCLLAEGDRLQLRLSEVVLEDEGARMVRGVLSAHRLDGATDVLLASSPISEPLSEAVEVPPEPIPDLSGGFGVFGGAGRGGWIAGGLFVSRAWRAPLLGWRVSLAGVALAGPGDWSVAAGPFVRF